MCHEERLSALMPLLNSNGTKITSWTLPMEGIKLAAKSKYVICDLQLVACAALCNGKRNYCGSRLHGLSSLWSALFGTYI
jgi:hypothetical protein